MNGDEESLFFSEAAKSINTSGTFILLTRLFLGMPLSLLIPGTENTKSGKKKEPMGRVPAPIWEQKTPNPSLELNPQLFENGWYLGSPPTTGTLATVPFSCSAPHRCGSEVSRGGEVCHMEQ